ncbi:hypothetical protein Tco_1525798 [Tanacetum coccineum]
MEYNKSIHRFDEQKNLYKALVDTYKSDKLIHDTYGDTVSFKRRRDDEDKDEESSAGSNRGSKRRRARKEPESTSALKEKTSKTIGKSIEGSKSHHKSAQNKTLHAAHGPIQPWISSLVRKEVTRDSFNELVDTPLDFSAFVMNWIKVDTLTHELLAGLTFELMKGSCKSLVELQYFLEEVYKATTNQLDWNNPEGQQYPHDLRNPLPLIPNSQGRRVIPFDHFINNDLEYLRVGTSSRTYATSVTKTKAADYGHVKWIEDLQFYGFAVNRESARDVYSRHRIIVVTKLQIVEWHNYKHLDWITVRRNDDKQYTFKEGDYKRLRLQDIKDMLLLLVQGKLTNLTIEECLALNVSLRMFIRSIVIQRRVEDLQLGVESYQKKLNLTRLDTCRSNLKSLPTYLAYPNPRGFIYQNKYKKNKLMHIDKLHKFSDSTLNDVRTTLDDILKRIRMKYLPQTYWKKVDKDRAGAMIQAINKQLKNRRIMRSCENLLGGRKVKMEILLEPTSNKLMVEHVEFDESDTHVLERFDTSAGNPIKEILPKLNLPYHRSILTDSKEFIKMDMERRSIKVKELQERCIINAFQDHQIKKGQAKEQAQDLKSMITTSIHKLMIEAKDYELKTKVKSIVF